jgi:seryl-tRNA synthetase
MNASTVSSLPIPLLEEASALELDLFHRFETSLETRYTFISVPSLIHRSTVERQGVVPWERVFKVNESYALSGSAEQGILEVFANQVAHPKRYWAKNQCFRPEDPTVPWVRLWEFQKVELFSFCEEGNWEEEFNGLLTTATEFLQILGVTFRVREVTHEDPGYHIKKSDIEVLTSTFGWLETHSCTYFGEEQTRRFGIQGATHTISNTGLASPRILVPLLEAKGWKL